MKDGTVFLVLQIRISHNELSNHAFANYAYQKYKPMVYLWGVEFQIPWELAQYAKGFQWL